MRKLLVIAGPCSAESREQVLETAQGVAAAGAGMLRAGLWKPRTRPGTFEGVGEQGLGWLLEAGRSTGLKVCTEVECAEHVRACVSAGVDAVWIGARTTANPFMVQEIAQALSGSPLTVFVKNPVNPDIELWAGAVERLKACGVADIGIIHRGFTSSAPISYRNDPQWRIALEMRSRYPQMPFLCDPSHLGGSRDLITPIAQKALDLGLDGLMVEVHRNPSEALSDSEQQLDPKEFAALLSGLVVRCSEFPDNSERSALEALRSRIDSLDEEIISLLSERMKVSREIGQTKKRGNVAIVQTSRWEEVLGRALEYARSCGLDEDFTRNIFNSIHEASVEEQNKILEKK